MEQQIPIDSAHASASIQQGSRVAAGVQGGSPSLRTGTGERIMGSQREKLLRAVFERIVGSQRERLLRAVFAECSSFRKETTLFRAMFHQAGSK